MGAKNKVIAGDYEGCLVTTSFGTSAITKLKGLKFEVNIPLDSEHVEEYQVITDDVRKSALSGAARGLVGGFLLGPAGLLAGGLTAKKKGVYNIAIQFKDGTKALVEVDDKAYKAIMTNCF
ncbi:hypothetical protein [Adlercreutzia sp.]|uniref:hypothetical protein n=1 Tax=Adlercreutzia sp. TaxID=1872387 RepID=UPI003AB47EFB